MSKVMLKLRELQTGEGGVKELDGIDAAIAWLKERPRFVEVLGVVSEGIPREDNDRMRAAMRALDADEAALMTALDAKAEAERAERAEARRIEGEKQAEAARGAAKNADPNRPMELRYRYDQEGLAKTDPLDERAITEDATRAVMEWVHERMEWVVGRGQTVGEAKVSVYPGVVPAKAERIVSGSFVPVTAPPKGKN